ncbi:hypothetical protein SDC9_139800 [bioreactor metagenome]|uniref:Uncharacterized protein n=1 Tax=bioreactor metagenome TaxID=1076179 RepID=A0A645DTQ7_9ZZZZ
MRQNIVGHHGQLRRRLSDPEADFRMQTHVGHFRLSERAGLEQDALVDGNLSDVVQNSQERQLVHLPGGQPKLPARGVAELLQPLCVLLGLGASLIKGSQKRVDDRVAVAFSVQKLLMVHMLLRVPHGLEQVSLRQSLDGTAQGKADLNGAQAGPGAVFSDLTEDIFRVL